MFWLGGKLHCIWRRWEGEGCASLRLGFALRAEDARCRPGFDSALVPISYKLRYHLRARHGPKARGVLKATRENVCLCIDAAKMV